MTRLDILLVDRGFYPTRAKAAQAIKACLVTVNGVRATKPSREFPDDAHIKARPLPFVSGRGWYKLDSALREFKIDVTGTHCLDVGASTGGFTEVLLNHGAAHVIAVDVGTAQMVPELRNDPRVTCLEKQDIRTLEPMGKIDLITIDVSFISMTQIIPQLVKWNAPRIIALIKPQFEVSRKITAKARGMVRCKTDRWSAVGKVINAWRKVGYRDVGMMESPITGGCGNIEYLVMFEKL